MGFQDKCHVLICSANMGNAEPDPASIAAWIPDDGLMSPARDSVGASPHQYFDVIVIGMQEATFEVVGGEDAVVPLTDNVVVKNVERVGKEVVATVQQLAASKDYTKKNSSSFLPSDWQGGTKELHGLIQQRLPSYELNVAYQRGQMRLLVFTRQDSKLPMAVVSVKAENTGLGSVAANKGGIMALLNIKGTRIAFITAHLEAHEGTTHYQGRCSDLAEILGGTTQKVSGVPYDVSLYNHYCFVSGDLNFRTAFDIKNKEIHNRKARNAVEQENWQELGEADELQHALREHDCLWGFETPPCNFPPTFKVERQEGFNYKENRTPSYTDRILYRCAHKLEGNVKTLQYEPIPLFKTSDHKPIRGAFEINLNREIRVDHSSNPKLMRRRSMRNLFGTQAHNDDNLHLFFNNLICESLKSRSPAAQPDPYITFVSQPKQLVRKERSTGQKWKQLFGLLEKNKKGDVVERTTRGWTRTSKKTNDSNPDWSGEEIHLVTKTSYEGSAITDLTGAMLFITVHDGLSVREDNVIGTFALNLAQLYLASKEHDVSSSLRPEDAHRPSIANLGKRGSILDYFGMGRRSEQADNPNRMSSPRSSAAAAARTSKHSTTHSTDVVKTFEIDEPLLKNGKEQGRIRCSIDTWWYNESKLLQAERRHSRETKSGWKKFWNGAAGSASFALRPKKESNRALQGRRAALADYGGS